MIKKLLSVTITSLTVICCFALNNATAQKSETSTDNRPNIVLLVADDMGYSDLGVYGSEISTPHLDALAQQSLLFTNFHTAPTCSPTRAMLLSGVDNHRAGLGTMFGLLSRAPNQQGKPGYEGYLNDKVVTVATLLKNAGYHTYITGKWHLGDKEGYLPNNRGFEHSFVLVPGGASHYSDRTQYGFKYQLADYNSNGKRLEKLPKDFYSTHSYTNKMIEFIESHREDGKPFFAYLAYTAPHAPLHAPDEYIQKYLGKYDSGWDKLRSERFKRMQELGIIPEYLELPARRSTVTPWHELSSEEQRVQAKNMAIYAAMIDYLDMSIGQFLEYLKTSGEFDNTIIIFLSDNGADDLELTAVPKFRNWLIQKAKVDNSYENLGKYNSYVSLTPAWAHVSNLPLSGGKGMVAEGGTRVPFFVYYPKSINPAKTEAFASVLDIMPTLLDYAGIKHPGTHYEDRRIYSLDGKSMRPLWDGRKAHIYGNNEPIGFELFGSVNKALYLGDWKILKLGEDKPWNVGKNEPWKLYNLRLDPTERYDLSTQYPKQLKKMLSLYEQYEQEVGFVPIKP